MQERFVFRTGELWRQLQRAALTRQEHRAQSQGAPGAGELQSQEWWPGVIVRGLEGLELDSAVHRGCPIHMKPEERSKMALLPDRLNVLPTQ